MLKWHDKVAVITGASTGMGAAIAVELAKNKMTVVGLARRKDNIEKLANDNKHLQGKIHAVECDIMKPESIAAAFDWVERNFGGVDVLVNNAGVIRHRHLTDLNVPDEDYLDQINTNFTGMVLTTRRALKTMKEREFGYVININSIAGHSTPDGVGVKFGGNIYGATKWAVTNLTEVLRLELGQGKKIRVTSLSPAGTRTDHIKGIPEEFLAIAPVMQPSDIADAVVYLLSTKPEINVSELTIHPTGDIF